MSSPSGKLGAKSISTQGRCLQLQTIQAKVSQHSSRQRAIALQSIFTHEGSYVDDFERKSDPIRKDTTLEARPSSLTISDPSKWKVQTGSRSENDKVQDLNTEESEQVLESALNSYFAKEDTSDAMDNRDPNGTKDEEQNEIDINENPGDYLQDYVICLSEDYLAGMELGATEVPDSLQHLSSLAHQCATSVFQPPSDSGTSWIATHFLSSNTKSQIRKMVLGPKDLMELVSKKHYRIMKGDKPLDKDMIGVSAIVFSDGTVAVDFKSVVDIAYALHTAVHFNNMLERETYRLCKRFGKHASDGNDMFKQYIKPNNVVENFSALLENSKEAIARLQPIFEKNK